MKRISTGELSRIRDKTRDLEQDALPLHDDPAANGGGDEAVKNRTQKSIDYAECPHHKHDGSGPRAGMTGLIAIDNKTVAFRPHSKKVGKVTIPCPGSGVIYERKGLDG
jgi:hypothetical protein